MLPNCYFAFNAYHLLGEKLLKRTRWRSLSIPGRQAHVMCCGPPKAASLPEMASQSIKSLSGVQLPSVKMFECVPGGGTSPNKRLPIVNNPSHLGDDKLQRQLRSFSNRLAHVWNLFCCHCNVEQQLTSVQPANATEKLWGFFSPLLNLVSLKWFFHSLNENIGALITIFMFIVLKPSGLVRPHLGFFPRLTVDHCWRPWVDLAKVRYSLSR